MVEGTINLKVKCPSCGERKSRGVGLWRRHAVVGLRIWYTTFVFVACRACGVYRVVSAVELREEERADVRGEENDRDRP